MNLHVKSKNAAATVTVPGIVSTKHRSAQTIRFDPH